MFEPGVHCAADGAVTEAAVVTRANVETAVVAGCRQRLLLSRRVELEALRRGFTFGGAFDLALQLAPIPCEQLMLLVCDGGCNPM